ncbi:MAG: XRE family transcriptional regulator [Chloroflexi bacterium CFX7]|nr:XRE family transcriptional regulator [Chloroflexi bacterium CFX7]RIL02066.1 MAG: XRE family transcriptional regulator [bacterium]
MAVDQEAKDDWTEFRRELLEDPATRAAYEARKPAFEFAVQLAELRRQKGLSQAALAKLAGMTQPEVARLEAAEASPTFDTMARLLAAAGADLDIKFRDAHGKVVRLPMVLKGAELAPRSKRGPLRQANA